MCGMKSMPIPALRIRWLPSIRNSTNISRTSSMRLESRSCRLTTPKSVTATEQPFPMSIYQKRTARRAYGFGRWIRLRRVPIPRRQVGIAIDHHSACRKISCCPLLPIGFFMGDISGPGMIGLTPRQHLMLFSLIWFIDR